MAHKWHVNGTLYVNRAKLDGNLDGFELVGQTGYWIACHGSCRSKKPLACTVEIVWKPAWLITQFRTKLGWPWHGLTRNEKRKREHCGFLRAVWRENGAVNVAFLWRQPWRQPPAAPTRIQMVDRKGAVRREVIAVERQKEQWMLNTIFLCLRRNHLGL